MRFIFKQFVVTLAISVAAYAGTQQYNATLSSSSAHFVLVHDLQASHAKQIAEHLETTYSRFFSFFKENGFKLTEPNEQLTWFCFENPENFDSYISSTENMNLSWLSSYYSAKTNSVAILFNPEQPRPLQHNVASEISSSGNIMAAPDNDYVHASDGLRIGHELAHQLAFNTGLQKRRIMYPIWVSEGLATAFEMQLSGNCRGLGCRKLVHAHNMNNLIPLDEFISMTRLPSDSAMHPYVYAQAQAFFNFLLTNHPVRLQKYLKNLHSLEPGWRSDESMLREFTDVFGPVEILEREWLDHVSVSVMIASNQ